MTRGTIVVAGELFVTLDAVAHCYEVEVAWLLEVHEHGLLGRTAHAGDALVLAVDALDRLARVLRLHRQLGLDLAGIALILGEPDDPTAR
ncbi:MAG: hypothetical protein H6825_16090 [Planctomycetes bacterium]|nr:hypothetical protein [Planctomycetota bacterium]